MVNRPTILPETNTPTPCGPLLSNRQLRWHEMEVYGFLHFTTNTFTDKEWGFGDESPSMGAIMPGTPSLFNWLGGGRIGAVPVAVIVTLLLFLFFAYVLQNTRFGRALYAVGGNKAAARASGFNTARLVTTAYVLSGLMAGLASWMLLGKLEVSVPNLGTGYTLDTVAAAVIGGVALTGGKGTIWGAFAGVLLLSIVNNGLNLMEVDPFWVNGVRGLIILVALLIEAQKVRFKPHVVRTRPAAA